MSQSEGMNVPRPAGAARARGDTAAAARAAAGVVGAVFLLVGVLGFIPGITSNYDAMEFAGHESGAELFGVFQVSVLHNVVHILFGLLGLVAARRWDWARTYLIAGGIIYLGLMVFGMIVEQDDDANFVPLNDADNWLHLGLGAAMLLLGLALHPRTHRHAGDLDRRDVDAGVAGTPGTMRR